ncbi:MAG: type IX secretion system membrane protein PorP/SprF [Bacteroidales bacterium]
MRQFFTLKKLAFFVVFSCVGQMAFAQQLPLYSQYMFNKFLINPAHAGSDGFTSYNITAREQWVGYSGAPRTYSFSGQTRFMKKSYRLKQNIWNRTKYVPKSEGKVGMGGYIFSDRNGLVQRTGFQMAYSYHFWVADYTQLSLGLAMTGYYFKVNVDEGSFEYPNEPLLNDKLRRGVFVPDIDFGAIILDPRYEIGFSALQMAGAAAKIGNGAYHNYWMDRHFYLFGSYNLYSGTKTEWQPSILLKMSEQVRPQMDLGFNYIYDQSFWAGLAYRTGAGGALIANVRFRFVPSRVMLTSMYFGYAFDFTLNKIQRATYGTHEVTLAIKFGDTNKKFRWLDRY